MTAFKWHSEARWRCSSLSYLKSAVQLSAPVEKLNVLGRESLFLIFDNYLGSTFVVVVGGLQAFTFAKRVFIVYTELNYDPTARGNLDCIFRTKEPIRSRSTRNYWSFPLRVSIPFSATAFPHCCQCSLGSLIRKKKNPLTLI